MNYNNGQTYRPYKEINNLTTFTYTGEVQKKSPRKGNYLDFVYPTRHLNTYWECPFSVDGGFFSWIYKKWEVENKKSKTIWRGKIILGFKKLSVTYTCGPIEAYLIWQNNNKNLVKTLIDWVENPEKYGFDKDDNIEDTRLFK